MRLISESAALLTWSFQLELQSHLTLAARRYDFFPSYALYLTLCSNSRPAVFVARCSACCDPPPPGGAALEELKLPGSPLNYRPPVTLGIISCCQAARVSATRSA